MQLSDREFWPEIPDGESVFLHQLAVRPSYRRSGISDAIVAHSAELTQRLGRRFLRLDCAVDRVKLRLLYERLGFRRHSDIVAGEWHVARFEMEVARPRAG
jgi:ribosomal protein S18 acetylase RimI-like enzyme